MNIRESLLIKNFGPIEDVFLDDISPLTVFIGESGSGKSTILKVLVLFRWIYKKMCMRSYLRQSGLKAFPFRFRFDQYVRNNGFTDFLNHDTEIEYTRGACMISYCDGKLNTANNVSDDELSFDKLTFITDKRNLIPELLSKRIRESVSSFFLNETYLDFLEASESVKNIEVPYLDVNLIAEKKSNGLSFFVENKEKNFKVHFEDSSSGMQNTLPMEFLLEYFVNHYDLVDSFNKSLLSYVISSGKVSNFKPVKDIDSIKNKNIFMHIEEPELSLYPDMQVQFLRGLIRKCFTNKREVRFKVSLTTHSPYIVNFLNLAAKSKMMDFNDISVYLVHDGSVESLKHPKEQVFDTSVLSQPISDIYREFNSYNENA